MKIERIFFGNANGNNYNIKEIGLEDSYIKEIENSLLFRRAKLPSINESFTDLSRHQRRFKIDSETDDVYYIEVIKKLYNASNEDADFINSLDELASKKKFHFIMYIGEPKNSGDDISKVCLLFKTNNNFVYSSRSGLLGFTKRAATSNLLKLTLVPENSLIQLPIKEYFASFNIMKNNRITANIYNPITFDNVFSTYVSRTKYAHKTLTQFLKKKIKLTNNNLNVTFGNNNESNEFDEIQKKINADKMLQITLASCTVDKRSTIKKISKETLKNAFNGLKKYCKENECKFSEKNIPKIQNNNIIVTSDSLPIFCSILRNDIVQNILSGKIRIPYYEQS